MENFFIDDSFYREVEDYLIDTEMEEEQVKSLPDDWQRKVQLANLEKMIKVNDNFIVDIMVLLCDANEDRFPEEDFNGKLYGQIKQALKESIDLNKLNSLMPELYYTSKETAILTKQDLLDAI